VNIFDDFMSNENRAMILREFELTMELGRIYGEHGESFVDSAGRDALELGSEYNNEVKALLGELFVSKSRKISKDTFDLFSCLVRNSVSDKDVYNIWNDAVMSYPVAGDSDFPLVDDILERNSYMTDECFSDYISFIDGNRENFMDHLSKHAERWNFYNSLEASAFEVSKE